MRRALFLLAGVTALGLPGATVHAQAASAVQAATDPYAAFIAEAAQRFGIPAAWIRAVIRVESHSDRHGVSSTGAMGLMQIMPETWAALRARYGFGRDPSIRATTSSRAPPFCATCTTATDRRAFLRPTTRAPAATRRIATGIVRCRPRPSLMLRRLSLLSGRRDRWACPRGGARSDVLDPSAAVHHAIGKRRGCRSCSIQTAAGRHAGCRRHARPVGHRAAIGRPVRPGFRSGAEAMITPFSCGQSAAPPRSARALPGRAVVSGVSIGGIQPLDSDFAGKRSAAYSPKGGRAERGAAQEPTDRGQVKSPCHAGIQAAVAACLLAGRPVGRWQAARLFPTISRLRPAHCRSRPAFHFGGAAR